jgi:hypothetical protein
MFGWEELRRDFAASDMDFKRNAIGNDVVDSMYDFDRGSEDVAYAALSDCGISNVATGGRQSRQRVDQDVSGKWLNEKGDAADFRGPLFDRFMIVRTHEYDGDREARLGKLLRKFNAATLAKLNIDNEADGFSHHRSIKELFSRSIEFCVVSEC